MQEKLEVVVIFDSGVGGLTTLSEIDKFQLHGPFVYLADTLNAPYGNKSKGEIVEFVLTAFAKLATLYSFKSIILACNTASAYTKKLLEQTYQIPVFSVTDSAISYVNALKNTHTVDVLSTQLTKESHIYKQNITSRYVREIACPRFVSFIESDRFRNIPERRKVVFDELIGKATDNGHHVILGCTHYPLLRKEIQEFYGGQTHIIDPSVLLARELTTIFPHSSMAVETEFFITAPSSFFDEYASFILKKTVTSNITEEVHKSKTY